MGTMKEVTKLDNCNCGTGRRQFWLWVDSNGTPHASRFQPTMGTVRSVVAATARDALLTMTGGIAPKHTVYDVDDPNLQWVGRCQEQAIAS